jgi:MSHA biogenesis protein MshL
MKASGKGRVASGGTPVWLAVAAVSMATGCAPLQVKEQPALPAIRAELDQAVAAPKAASPALPPAVAAALAPQAEVKLEAAPAQAAEPRFDLAVNNAPAQQVFLGIASGTRYSMLLHPDVAGSITVNLKDVTVPEAMAAIRELYGYDYRIDGNRIFVQPLTAQTRFYSIPYPTAVRQGKSELRVTSGSIADSSNTAPGTSGANAMQLDSSRVETESHTDFWHELKDSVALLIGCSGGTCPADRSVVVSPITGMLAVRALPKEQREVAEYLRSARLSVEREVMIEAKIIEVTLNEGAQSGVNWAYFNQGSSLSKGSSAGSFPVPKGTPFNPSDPSGGTKASLASLLGTGLPASSGATTGNGSNAGLFGLALQTTNFMALIDFLQTQGGVQVLSSPRIAALNNQKAVLKVGTDEFFVTNVSTTTNTGVGSGTTTPNVTLQPFFSGIALDVTPQIDDAGNIILHVHPSVSQVSTVEKNINLGGSTLGNLTLPLASSAVSETDSVVRLHDGEIAAIGGLMSRSSQDTKSSVPLLGDIPGLGALFRNDSAARAKHELVILLKPTVIRQASDWVQGVNAARDRLQ